MLTSSPLNGMDVAELLLQQDGATYHTARDTINLLREKFDERIISSNGPVNWPPRTCDLTPMDNFLWGYVNSLIYADKPHTYVGLLRSQRLPRFCRYTATVG